MYFFDGQFDDALVHPRSDFQFFYKLILNVGHDLITKILGLGRESFLHKEAAQDPAQAIIDVVDAYSPALGRRIWVLLVVRPAKRNQRHQLTFPWSSFTNRRYGLTASASISEEKA